MSRRTERVAEQIRHEISRIILAELSDPRIGFVTLTRVEVSPDFSLAKVFVSVLETEGRQRSTLEALNSARRRIQNVLSESLKLRRTPALLFQLDQGIKHSIHISSLLSDLARARGDAPPPEGPEPQPDEDSEEEEPEDHDG